MANLKEIRTRIGSVKNTRKITSAMSRIAAARLRKAQSAMEAARDYGDRMQRVVGELVGELADPGATHALLNQRDVQTAMIVLVTADRGLCGGFNTNPTRQALRLAERLDDEGKKVVALTVGRKSGPLLRQAGIEVVGHHAAPTIDDAVERAAEVVADVLGAFHDHEDPQRPKVEQVFLVFNQFKNVITQVVRDDQLLPVPPIAREGEGGMAVRGYEPDMATLLDHLLPTAVETAIQQAFFNSAAAEIAARRASMDSATDNATELIGELTLEYNRERQAAITKELMEIVGGAEALRG